MADINKHNEEEEEQLIAQLKDDSQGPGRINASNGNMASTLLDVISAIFLPLTFCSGCVTVNEKEEVIVQRFGEYKKTITEPGLHWCFPNQLQINHISTKLNTLDLKNVKIIDSVGNPINVSAIVVYKVVNSKKAFFNVEDFNSFIEDQSQTVIRQVVSKYPYETDDDTPNLKRENKEIQEELRNVLQEKVAIAGIYVKSVMLNELSYAVEIAAAMLKKQQAKAIVDAREIILNGTIGLAVGAVQAVESQGITMNDNQKAQLVSNILTVSLSDKEAQPTVQL
jgi:regulator of protease activity HflC (stomatin/prohibitin superfamily)